MIDKHSKAIRALIFGIFSWMIWSIYLADFADAAHLPDEVIFFMCALPAGIVFVLYLFLS